MDVTPRHPAWPTHPELTGAPLPEGEVIPIKQVALQDIEAELIRAEVELLYAIGQHRKSWAKVRALHLRILREEGFPDSDPTYKKATGDVTWWRGEMDAQANTIQALRGLRADRLAAATDTRRGRRMSREDKGGRTETVRQAVMGWQPGTAPSAWEIRAAQSWADAFNSMGKRPSIEVYARLEGILGVGFLQG